MARKNQTPRSICPISCALEIIGDKWTLLILRDIIYKRKQGFREFLASSESIASNILSDRLKRLEACNIVLRRRDPDNKRRIVYSLTEKGLDLIPVTLELLRWGAKHETENRNHDELIHRFEADPGRVIAEMRSSLHQEGLSDTA
ncbi:helix-turn-helix domain-containing protein [Nitrosovibrio sp. Nv17]|uniref:winged helix-turn-helix transcriptional regulator n=1 Tax=Nitrosovibrio sp. Nv17 TaxID=1855339 RepID=UPI00090852E2|nr:helix-turn-helix domain-containing protein [Nitrosovibrio sp. Nv17]SFW28648.1 transcriptional regulator, HxlR family [Nitrosovibrio sp. Nv17]